MQVETAQLLAAITQQNELLSQILNELRKPQLGLVEAPTLYRIYANRSNNCLWYTVRDGEVQPIIQTALTGYLQSLKFEKVERRGKEVTKLMLYIRADRSYCIESGYESHFSKGLLATIASLNPEQIKLPITVMPQAGEDESVLFCRVFVAGQPIMATYNEQTDFRSLSRQALSLISPREAS